MLSAGVQCALLPRLPRSRAARAGSAIGAVPVLSCSSRCRPQNGSSHSGARLGAQQPRQTLVGRRYRCGSRCVAAAASDGVTESHLTADISFFDVDGATTAAPCRLPAHMRCGCSVGAARVVTHPPCRFPRHHLRLQRRQAVLSPQASRHRQSASEGRLRCTVRVQGGSVPHHGQDRPQCAPPTVLSEF